MNIINFLFASLLIFGLVLLAGGTLIGYWFQKKQDFERKRFTEKWNAFKNSLENCANTPVDEPRKDQ